MLNRNVTIPIPCPKCQHKIQESIARLENNPILVCPACNFSFKVEAEKFRRGLLEVEKTLEKFRRK